MLIRLHKPVTSKWPNSSSVGGIRDLVPEQNGLCSKVVLLPIFSRSLWFHIVCFQSRLFCTRGNLFTDYIEESGYICIPWVVFAGFLSSPAQKTSRLLYLQET